MQQPVRPETMSARLGEIFSPPCHQQLHSWSFVVGRLGGRRSSFWNSSSVLSSDSASGVCSGSASGSADTADWEECGERTGRKYLTEWLPVGTQIIDLLWHCDTVTLQHCQTQSVTLRTVVRFIPVCSKSGWYHQPGPQLETFQSELDAWWSI